MKRLVSLLLALSIFVSLSIPSYALAENAPNFRGLNDPSLLPYMEDTVYQSLVSSLNGDYAIENVEAIYISQEYLDELAFNSQANVFFGHTLAEIDAQFEGTRYVFTLGENNETTVIPFEEYHDDTYERVLRNVATGAGVILVCVTVSSLTVTAAPAVSLIFACAADTAAITAVTGSKIGFITGGALHYMQTGNLEDSFKAGLVAGSEGFKWGAISGAIAGGLEEFSYIYRATKAVSDVPYFEPNSIEIPENIAAWKKAEYRALNSYGGYEQPTYLEGRLVPFGTKGGTRPDVVRFYNDYIEAVEVKYYDLEQSGCLNTLYKELTREVSDRVINLPKGSTQRIILDVTDRGYDSSLVELVKTNIWDSLDDIYPNIPIDVVGLL